MMDDEDGVQNRQHTQTNPNTAKTYNNNLTITKR